MRAGLIASTLMAIVVTLVATIAYWLAMRSAPLGTTASNQWFLVLLGTLIAATGVFLPLGIAFDRALKRWPQRLQLLESDSSGSASGENTTLDAVTAQRNSMLDRMLQSAFDAATAAIQRSQARERALRSDLMEMEIRLRVADSQRKQYEAVLASLKDGVLVTDNFDELIMVNPAAAGALGIDERNVGHNPGVALAHAVSNERLRQLIRDARQTADFVDAHTAEVDLKSGDDDSPAVVYEANVRCVPQNKDRKEIGAVVTILHDLSREREVSQMKSDFVSKASHELRTPLASIRAYVEMLVDGEVGAEGDEQARQEFYRIIQSETDRLGRLIDNMLNISRIEAGIVQVQREAVDMQQVVARALHTMQPHAAEKNIALYASGGDGLEPGGSEKHGSYRAETNGSPMATKATAAFASKSSSIVTVEGDGDMLYQVVLNLVSNAIKYTPEGGRVTVSVDGTGIGLGGGSGSRKLARAGGEGHRETFVPSVVVSVTDTGLGVPSESLPKLFDKFYRIENYKRVAKGTGLGLHLCKHIVETVHHGQIGVDSKVGLGSKFWFSIPMRYAGKKAA